MIHYWEGQRVPVQLRPGDILFATGRLPVTTALLPFEHVALVAEVKDVHTDNDLADVQVYGLPESGSTSRLGLRKATAKYLRSMSPAWANIGSRTALWNMAARPRALSDLEETYMMEFLSVQSSRRFIYSGALGFDDEVFDAQQFHASCTGFVCSVLRKHAVRLLYKDCPKYPSPYTDGRATRDFPSPGHLAHALRLGKSSQPYRPKDEQEATQARVLYKDCPKYPSPYTDGRATRDFPSPGHLAHALRLGKSSQPYRPKDEQEAEYYSRASRTLAAVSHRSLRLRIMSFISALFRR